MEATKSDSAPETAFKKPLLVGKIGRLPKKLTHTTPTSTKPPPEEEDTVEQSKTPECTITPIEKKPENSKTVPYSEPPWSGLPHTEYSLEVLKNGSIIETIALTKRPFWLFGRLSNCDICMQHPTISRYHAVLQYRSEKTETSSTGFYIYDLESTHGTFLNKNRLRPRSFMKMHVGHMLKLGCSTRTYILTGPEEDAEEESAMTVTELKQKRQEELRTRQEKEEEAKRREEERGVDWGLGEDAEEETDLSENPYAQTNNEELYLDNPKKALRGFFEREGLELEYDCNEQGMGQFLCKVELPIDDEMGRPISAEVLHKGKKKEAVVQCALEACRILDRHGVLRQSTHESKKRKPKNWEENDYYDSDDDTFLDRTGSVEKKREMRMKAKQPRKAETYENLLEKEKKISGEIKELEVQLADAERRSGKEEESQDSEIDPLDSFMMELKKSKPSKQSVNKLKSELNKLKQEHGRIIKLANIAKPASLPPLVAEYDSPATTATEKKGLPLFGKRKKIKLQLPAKPEVQNLDDEGDDDEEVDGEETVNSEDSCTSKDFKTFVEEHKHSYGQLERIWTSLEQLANNRELVEAKQSQIIQMINDEGSNEDVSQELDTILEDLTKKTEQKSKKVDDERKKRRNQRRIQQKQEKAEMERQKGYAEDHNKEDYNMWVPPSGQSGDGRTSLNDKFGY